MEVDNSHTCRATAHAYDSVAAQEVRRSWMFAPASRPGVQHADAMDFRSPTIDNISTDQAGPFTFHHRSREATTQGLGDDSLQLARRQDAHKSTRLLGPGYGSDPTAPCLVSDAPLSTHTPMRNPVFIRQDSATSHMSQAQHSESHPSHLSDRKLASSHSRDLVATHRYHAVSKPRKSLSERLQGIGAKPFPINQPAVDLNKTQALAPEPTARQLIPSPPAAAEEVDNGRIFELNRSESQVSGLKTKRDPCSRSASVCSSSADAKGMQGVVMEAMKTIQRYEFETELQKSEIDRLNARIGFLEKEKDNLNNKVQHVKNASLQKLAISSQNLEVLRVDLTTLKTDLQNSASVSLADIQELKEAISHALNEFAQHRGKAGVSSGSATRSREIINELKLDCMNKQQVLDMLRDRLTDALSELATSKNRIFELEEAYAVDRLALKHASEQLAATGSRISELGCALKQQQKDSVDSVILAGDLELRLQASQSEVSRLEHLASEFKKKATDAASQEHHISKLESLVSFQKDRMSHFEDINEENVQLRLVVKDKEEQVRSLEEDLSQMNNLRNRNMTLEKLLEEQEHKKVAYDAKLLDLCAVKDNNTQLKTQLHGAESDCKRLESELTTKSQLLDELRALTGKMQANFDANCQSIKTLEAELASSWAREEGSREAEATEKTKRLEETNAKTMNAQHLTRAQERIQDLLVEAETLQKRFQDVETRYKSLQGRFEEQSITLRLARDTSAELQERLIAAESGFARDLEVNCGRLRTQIAVLQEQNTAIQIQLEHCKSDAEAKCKEHEEKEATLIRRIEGIGESNEIKCGDLRTEIAIVREQKSACQAQLKEATLNLQTHRAESAKKEADLLQQIEDGRNAVDREVCRAKDMKILADQELAEAVRRTDDLESRLARAQKQLQRIPDLCVTHEDEIDKLKAQVSHITAECNAMKERARSLNSRYAKGDLDSEERILIKTVIHATQSMHVHELAETQNELNRSKKMIDTLQNAKIVLENSLTKHLAAEAKLKTVATKASTTNAEYVTWPSSHPDVSMEDCAPPVQDRDEPSTAPDDSSVEDSARPLPAFDPIQVSTSPDRPPMSSVRFLTPGSATLNRNFAPPLGESSKGYFSALAQDQSDDIGEFEEPSAKKKRVQLPQAGKPETSKQAKNATKQTNVEQGTTKTTYKHKRKRR